MGHRIQMFSSQKKHPLLYSGCLPGENADSTSELAAGEAHAHDAMPTCMQLVCQEGREGN